MPSLAGGVVLSRRGCCERGGPSIMAFWLKVIFGYGLLVWPSVMAFWLKVGGSLSRGGLCQERHPLWWTTGRYASYWNAFLFTIMVPSSIHSYLPIPLFFIIHFQKLYIGSRFYLINNLELVEQMNLSFVRIFEYVLV